MAQYELTGPLPSLAIPTTLHDSLMARLDRQVTAKPVAQLGRLLAEQCFTRTAAGGLPFRRGNAAGRPRAVSQASCYQESARATYTFKHALIQDGRQSGITQDHAAAISPTDCSDALPALSRYRCHPARAVGASLHRGRAHQASPYPAGGRPDSALSSARPMSRRSVTSPEGLEVLQYLPATPERTQQELTLQLALGARS